MGLFDIDIQKEISSDKNDILNLLKIKILADSKESASIENNRLLLNDFKPNSVFLKFNLDIQFNNEGKKKYILINGDLQQILLLVILIVLCILFTYGLGLIILVGFIYYQKHKATKYLNHILEEIIKS